MKPSFYALLLVKDCEGSIIEFVKGLKIIPKQRLVILDQDSKDNTAQLARLLKAKVLLGPEDTDTCFHKGLQRIKYYQPQKIILSSKDAWERLYDEALFNRMLPRIQNLLVTDKKAFQKHTPHNTLAILQFKDVLQAQEPTFHDLLKNVRAVRVKK